MCITEFFPFVTYSIGFEIFKVKKGGSQIPRNTRFILFWPYMVTQGRNPIIQVFWKFGSIKQYLMELDDILVYLAAFGGICWYTVVLNCIEWYNYVGSFAVIIGIPDCLAV